MDIGVEQETIVIEPVESPVPAERTPPPREPEPEPERERERELEPVGA